MRDLIRFFFKYKILITFSFIFIFGLTILKVIFTPPLYEATVLLKFEMEREPTALQANKIDITQSMQLIKSHKIKIKSRPVLKMVIENLNLTENKNFAPPQIKMPAFLQKLFINLFPQFTINESGIVTAKSPMNYTLKKLSQKVLIIEEVPFTNFLKLSIRLPDAELAAALADEIAREYSLWNIDFQSEEAARILAFIKSEVNEMDYRVQFYESKIEEFKQKEGLKISDLGKSETGNILENMGTYEYQSQLRMKLKNESLEKKLQEVDEKTKTIIYEMPLHPGFIQFRSDMEKIEMKRALLLKNFTEEHPKIIEIDRSIKSTNSKFLRLFLNDIEQKYGTSSGTEESDLMQCIMLSLDTYQLKTQHDSFSKIKKDIYEKNWVVKEKFLPDQARELSQLSRQLRISESNYKFLYEEMEKARIHMAKKDTEEIKIVQPAEVPDIPVSRPMNVLIVGFLISIFFSISLAWFSEIRKTTFGAPSEKIERELGLSLLATSPYKRLLWHRRFRIHSDQAQSFERLEAQINSPFEVRKNLLITSSQKGEGKTTTAVNLARYLALQEKKILLIDCASYKRNSLTVTFRVTKSLKDMMAEGTEITFSKIKNEGFDFLFLSRHEHEISKLLLSDSFIKLIQDNLHSYDLIIYDSPDLFSSSIALYLAKITHNVLLVIEAEKTRKEIINRAIRSLNNVNAKVLGIFLNKVRYHIPDFIYKKT